MELLPPSQCFKNGLLCASPYQLPAGYSGSVLFKYGADIIFIQRLGKLTIFKGMASSDVVYGNVDEVSTNDLIYSAGKFYKIEESLDDYANLTPIDMAKFEQSAQGSIQRAAQ